MSSNDDGATKKQADNKLCISESSDLESDFETVSNNDDVMDIKNNESASNSVEISENTITSTKSGSIFDIRKKIRTFASMRQKNPEKVRTSIPAFNASTDSSTPLPSNDDNPEEVSTNTETTESNAHAPPHGVTGLGIRNKLSLEGAFASFRGKDSIKKRAPLQRSDTEVYRKNSQRISFISLPDRGSGPSAKPPTASTASSQECIQPILEEFIATEESYIENLWIGINNYGQIFQRPDLPETLRGKEYSLLANIEDIGKFHRDQLLPMLQKHRINVKRIFMELQYYIEQKHFHIYMAYTINKQRSMQLIVNHRSYFDILEKEFSDRLGINSFLLQPIQRVARYPLLLTQFISTLFKLLNSESNALMTTCCRLESKLRNLLNTINESECINDIVGVDVSKMFSSFLRVGNFEIYDHSRKRSYQGKLFMFENYLILTKIVGKQLVYRQRYNCDYVQVSENDQGFSLFYKQGDSVEHKCDFIANPNQVELWVKLLQEVIPVEPIDFNVYECLDEKVDAYSPEGYSKVSDFDIYDHTLERRYPAKVYLFDECITYGEVIGERVKFRGCYPFDHVGATPCDGWFTLFYLQRHQQKCDFRAEPVLIKEWLDLIHGNIKIHFKRKMSLPRGPDKE